jgi:hypothetical protein
MKFLLATIGLIAAGAAGTGFVCYDLNCNAALHTAAAQGDALAWLRADFRLTDAQFAAIRQLHAAYAPSCEEHCRLIREATQLRDLAKAANMGYGVLNNVLTPLSLMPATTPSAYGEDDPVKNLATAEQKLRALHATCEAALTTQVRAVAALMSREDGERYLALLLPKIAAFDHAAAPDLHLNHR